MSPQVFWVLALGRTHISVFYFSTSMPMIPIQTLVTLPWFLGIASRLLSLAPFLSQSILASAMLRKFRLSTISPLFLHPRFPSSLLSKEPISDFRQCSSSCPIHALKPAISHFMLTAIGALPPACKHVQDSLLQNNTFCWSCSLFQVIFFQSLNSRTSWSGLLLFPVSIPPPHSLYSLSVASLPFLLFHWNISLWSPMIN